MRTLERQGWTLKQWKALSENEKRRWLAWDERKRKVNRALFDALKDAEKLTPEVYAMLVKDLG